MIGYSSEAELRCLANIKSFTATLKGLEELAPLMRNKWDKWQRYRVKLVAAGRCPHCGKPCAPYRECEERRQKKAEYVKKRRQRLNPNYTPYRPIGPDDKRKLPHQRHHPGITPAEALGLIRDQRHE